MKDSDDQDLGAGNFQESALIQRLLRRANEPIGVVNLRHAAQLGARTAGWIERRFELLDNWKTRYGLEQGAAGAGGGPLSGTERIPPIGPFQSIAVGGLGPSSLVQPSVMRTAMPGTGDETASNAPPLRQFRVKRVTAIPDANCAKVPRETEPVSSDAPDAVHDTSAPRADQSSLLPQATEIRVSTSSSRQMHLQRRAIGERETTITSGEAEGSAGLSSPHETPAGEGLSAGTAHDISSAAASLPQVSELPPAGCAAVPMPLQHKALETMPPTDGEAEGSSVPLVPARVQPMKISQHLSARSPAIPTGLESLPHVTELRRASGSSAAPVHLQRKLGNNPVPAKQPGTGTPKENGGAPVSGAENRLPTVSREIRPMPSAASTASIVWRKADAIPAGAAMANAFTASGLSTSSMHASEPQIMRETASSALAASSVSPPVTTAAAPTSGNHGIDVGQMAERINRMIARQMAIERERRGKTK